MNQHKDKIKGQFVLVEDDVEIGDGTKIWNYVHIMKGAKIGKNVVIGDYTHIGPGVHIGDGCKIQNRCDIYEGVTLEDDVFIGPNVTFTNVKRPKANHIVPASAYAKTLVKRGATIGANCTVICGAEVGEESLVAAGNVLQGDQKVPPNVLAKGFPIRQYRVRK